MHPKIIEGKLAAIASRHLHPRHIDAGLDNFRKHMAEELSPEQVSQMDSDGTWTDYADQFFKGCAESAPSLSASSSSSGSGSSTSTAGSSSASRGAGWAATASPGELRAAGYDFGARGR